MDIKVFKRTSGKDVFEKLDEQEDLPDSDSADSTPDAEAAEQSEEPDGSAGSADDETPPPTRRKGLRRRIGTAVAVVLFVAALGLPAFLGWQLKQQSETAAAGGEALAMARDYAVTLTSVDTNKIDENFAHVIDGATGEFKDMYSQSANQLRQLLIDNKAMSNGNVVDAAIKTTTKTRVEVLLFVDQSITNAVDTEPRIDRSRVRMTMELVDDRWLASKVDII